MSRIKYLSVKRGEVTYHEKQYAGFYCPACKEMHFLGIGPHAQGPQWAFNMDEEEPAFHPSVLRRWETHEPPVTAENHEEYRKNPWPQRKVQHVCHSFIGCNGARPGQIIYLGDCTHSMAGMVVDLPEIPDELL